VNWNILVTSGKEIKRDSMSSVNESRKAYRYIYYNVYICIQESKILFEFYGEPSSKAKYYT
jgi:hypothetical protein